MKVYLLQNDENPLDNVLIKSLGSLAIEYKVLSLPNNHEDVIPLLKEKEGGLVIFPAIWADLFCVKIIQEITLLSIPFETVIVDSEPDSSKLILAFNEGLTAYLERPVTEEKLQQIVSRARSCFEKKIEYLMTAQHFSDLESQSIPFNRSKAMTVRNQYLGQAFIDIVKKTGPLVDSEVEVLLVSSSHAQQKRLAELLKAIGISTTETKNIKEAVQAINNKEFSVIVSDGILPDGDAIGLVNSIRNISERVPQIIVWTSSPEKADAFLKPDNFINEVILKPGPETGIESILPSIIVSIYHT